MFSHEGTKDGKALVYLLCALRVFMSNKNTTAFLLCLKIGDFGGQLEAIGISRSLLLQSSHFDNFLAHRLPDREFSKYPISYVNFD